MTAWLGVAAAAHVRRAQHLGIAQLGHGKRAGLARLHPGDTLVYYSPTEELGGAPLRAFTAFGVIAEGEIWQAHEGDFHPFRRRVDYAETLVLPLAELRDELQFTAQPNWGYQLRRGLVQLDDRDAALIGERMRS